jgi:hypothetical protein
MELLWAAIVAVLVLFLVLLAVIVKTAWLLAFIAVFKIFLKQLAEGGGLPDKSPLENIKIYWSSA